MDRIGDYMSINNTSDFTAALNTVTTDISLTTPELNNRMKTDEFNSFFSEAQTSLETLYLKTRLLQDITAFVKNRIMTEGSNCLDQIKAIENNIDNTIDSYLDKDYIIKTIDLSSINKNSSLLTDINDAVVSSCLYNNNQVIMPAAVLKNGSIKSITVNQNRECYENNASSNLKVPYRTIYKMQSESELTGVEETLIILFNEEINCNYIDLQNMNCVIKSITGITSDGLESILDISNNYIKQTKIVGLKIVLSCDNYSEEIAQTVEQYKNNDFLKSESMVAVTDVSTIQDAENSLSTINNINYSKKINDTVEDYTDQLSDITKRNNNSNYIKDTNHIDNIAADSLSIASIISDNGSVTNYVYAFGIDSLNVEERDIKETAAAVFLIDITNCNKLEIEADVNPDNNESVEFYIVDNGKCRQINNVLKSKDNIDLSVANVSAIKVIFRYDSSDSSTDVIPPVLTRLGVRQFGGEVDWIL